MHFHQSNGLVECAIQTVECTLKKAKLANEDHYLSILFFNSQPDKNGLSPTHKLFSCPICTNVPSTKPQPNLLPKQQLMRNQNWVLTLRHGYTVRVRSDKEKTWDKKGSVIALDDCAHLCNVLDKKLT